MKPDCKLLLTGLFALGFAAAPAFASPPSATFEDMDADGDTLVTEAEFVDYAMAEEGIDERGAKDRFTVLAGPDGELTQIEYDAAMSVLGPDDGMADPDPMAGDTAQP